MGKLIYIVIALVLFFPSSLSAQRRVSADVEVKSVKDGKSVTVSKTIWCSGNGRLVARFHSPKDYYFISNFIGEASIYDPMSNEVLSSVSEDQSTRDDLLMIFLCGRVDDLSLSLYGYRMAEKRLDGETIIKTFRSSKESGARKVEIAYQDYLPIFVKYFDTSGRVLSKKYLSNYSTHEKGFVFPSRMVDIIYSSKKDSTVVRTLFSNIVVDSDDPMFDFSVPSDAVPASLEK